MATKIVSITDLRRDTSRIVRAAQEEGDVVYITRHGRPAAVMLGYEQYEALLAQLETLSDSEARQRLSSLLIRPCAMARRESSERMDRHSLSGRSR